MRNPYTCDKCDWEYAWTMGDRVKAAKRHQLAHLLEKRDASKRNEDEAPVRLSDYLADRLQTARWV